ncbi:imelysin family protein [Arcobacter roscoffensis]|uniref:Imelysin family protein n=1 Tax=Arcobacter roscoffensis TaxID=2961520 RepID=A0ABY5E907_9BACT|nr:imelysin family protein [Arcobacter roscoffensis]UTJ07220.1 imelysin family protein [Arcobacter roscoffensis]
MKKLLITTAFLATSMFAQTSLHSILENVSVPNVNKTIESAKSLKENTNKKNFENLVSEWKKVEALYFAGDIDENYIDTPRYIDVYHNLKEDLSEQMQRAIDSNDEPRIALFKNSFRTINALEYVLFNDEIITKREKLLAVNILDTIISNLEDIKDVYKEYLKTGSKSEKWENSLVINTLISSSYRLREWRVGEPSGYAAKYKNDPKNQRAEYYLSKNSLNAIKAILKAHDEVIGDKSYENFATMAKNAGAKRAIIEAQEALSKSLKELENYKNDDFSKAKLLYEATKELHNAYYLSLVEELAVTAKILDADGD